MQNLVITQNENKATCILPSDLTTINKSIEFLLNFLDTKKILLSHFEMRYVLREALNNAIIHGNKGNTDLLVKCIFEIDKNILVITIKDEGKGFDWKKQLAKSEAPSTATSGRGLKTIFKYGFNIDFNDSGNTLYLRKKFM